jgi:hypothetical protein
MKSWLNGLKPAIKTTPDLEHLSRGESIQHGFVLDLFLPITE